MQTHGLFMGVAYLQNVKMFEVTNLQKIFTHENFPLHGDQNVSPKYY